MQTRKNSESINPKVAIKLVNEVSQDKKQSSFSKIGTQSEKINVHLVPSINLTNSKLSKSKESGESLSQSDQQKQVENR